MSKKKWIYLIGITVAFLTLLASTLSQNSCTAAIGTDSRDDVQGGTIVSEENESYNVTCGASSSASFIDIKSITWDNDSTYFYVQATLWNPTDFTEYNSGDADIVVNFTILGSDVVLYHIECITLMDSGFNGTMYLSNETQSITGCGLCLVLTNSTTLTWKTLATFVSSNIPEALDTKDSWNMSAYSLFQTTNTMAWDVVNFTGFESYYGIHCVPGNFVTGYDLVLLLCVAALSTAFLVKKRAKSRRNS
nr:hypothetical protein [Candidatus Sigynarchaeota archaeon]